MKHINPITITETNIEKIIRESNNGNNGNELFDECNLGIAKSKFVSNIGGLALLGGYVIDSDVVSVGGSIGISYSVGKYFYHKIKYRT